MKWTLSQDKKFPFTYKITDEQGEVILEQRPCAYGSSQETIEDCMMAKGFLIAKRDEAIESNKRQRKNLERMVSTLAPSQQYEHLTVATEKVDGEYWMDGITRLVKKHEVQGWQVASMVDGTSYIIFKRPTVVQ